MNLISYTNRYGDVFTFEQLNNGNIQWSGNFEYSRIGMPNDYSKAWEVFQEEYGGLSYEDFKSSIHAYDEEKKQYVFPDLIPLISSKTDTISMVDPSGGPYIAEGTDMEIFGLEGTVKEFISNKDGYEIIIE